MACRTSPADGSRTYVRKCPRCRRRERERSPSPAWTDSRPGPSPATSPAARPRQEQAISISSKFPLHLLLLIGRRARARRWLERDLVHAQDRIPAEVARIGVEQAPNCVPPASHHGEIVPGHTECGQPHLDSEIPAEPISRLECNL